MATALIQFTQGATTGTAGQALDVTTGTSVSVANNSNTGVALQEAELRCSNYWILHPDNKNDCIGKLFVYGLIDPRTNLLRYVGKSTSGFHRFSSNYVAKCGAWRASLKAKGLRIIVIILEQCSTKEELCKVEEFTIANFRAAGCNLLNIADGGNGIKGGRYNMFTHPTKRVETFSPLTLEKMRHAHLGMKATKETKNKISKALTGLVRSDITRSKISMAKRGVKTTLGFKHSEFTKGWIRLNKHHKALKDLLTCPLPL